VSFFTQNFHPLRDSYNAFVVFVSRDDALSACAENGKLFQGMHLRVDIAANSSKTLDSRRVCTYLLVGIERERGTDHMLDARVLIDGVCWQSAIPSH
jgi:hypothetical protein